MKKHKLRLSKKVIEFLATIRLKHKVRVSCPPFEDFDINDFIPKEMQNIFAGCHFVSKSKHHLFVNPIQSYGKIGHDLIVLHEIGHVLLNKNNFDQQEEAFANGFAFCMAEQLKIKVDNKVRTMLLKYSESEFKRRKKRYTKRPQLDRLNHLYS